MKIHAVLKFAVLMFFCGTSCTATTLSVSPSSVTANLGDLFSVDIQVDQVSDLYSWQLDLTFNSAVIQAITVSEGDFLASGGATFFIPGAIDNTGGSITFNADSLETAISGVNGGGVLLSVQFQAIAQGNSPVDLANIYLYDSNLNPIAADSQGGVITVNGGSAVPEPGGRSFTILCLMALSFFLAARTHRRTIVAFLTAGFAVAASQAADIATAQIDAARTMANGSEIYLTTANVNPAKFGKLFARTVDGGIYAQPLYLQGVTISGKKINLIYVATSHNNVYAFDADNPAASTPVWTANLGQYDTPQGWNTGLGILSTPVIVRSLNTIYVSTATNENGARVQKLHALNLLTGAEKPGSPVVIGGTVTGTTSDAQNGVITFDPTKHIQRTGLAIAGNNVVLAYSSDRDFPPYHGWVFTYDAGTLQQTGIYNDARDSLIYDGYGSGIWQSGRAPAVDANGAVYLETGNGNYDGTGDFGESFVKLTSNSGGLSIADWFTPNAWQALNTVDYDLSSTGPTLIPGTNLLFGGAKSGIVYLMSTAGMGHISAGDANLVQSFTATTGCVIPYESQGCAQIMGHAFWPTAAAPTLFVWGVHDVLRAYQFVNGQFNTVPVSTGTTQAFYPGGVLSVSSYLGTAGTGILWAITCDTADGGFYFGPGFTGTATLHAFDANNIADELWNSSMNPMQDAVGEFASFTPPVAVGGKVYVPTFSNQLVVYGLLNGPVPGDVNGDSVVNCTDLAIVKAAFGKSAGQAGFDLRADVNGDGIVNVLDLSIVSRQLPAGTVCH